MVTIATCDLCGRDIVIPEDVLVWTEDGSYHRPCHGRILRERAAQEAAALLSPKIAAA